MENNIQPTPKPKILLKAGIIALIILILQIPAIYVGNLITEREERQKEAINEVSSKWAGAQNINGPVVIIPYWSEKIENGQNIRLKEYAFFLPDQLNFDAKAIPEERHRGIYKVILYTASVNIKGTYNGLPYQDLGLDSTKMLWNEAFVSLSIADAKGLNDEIKMKWNNQTIPLTMQTFAGFEGLMAPLKLVGPDDMLHVQFETVMNVAGSQKLLFTPSGKITTATLVSKWPHPSFSGDVLPQTKNVQKDGFTAQWKSLSFKRKFPQQWRETRSAKNDTSTYYTNIYNSSFGADFYIPVNAYQKTTRSVKYSFLCIVLTFAFFFIVETTNKKSVHPLQYGLIGVALILFYVLLLSFSEYIGFNVAYLIASAGTIGLIGWFINGILQSGKLTVILSMVLLLTYSYIFTILQLQDYALLLGSIGLFITLFVIMYFSRKIQW